MSLSDTEITARLQSLGDYEFEQFIAELWSRMGWDAQITSKSSDWGVDVIATRSAPYAEKELVQAKRYTTGNRVTGPEIQQYAALHNHEQDVDKVVVVTTSSFTDSALENADRSNVKTITGAKLARIINQLDAIDLVKNYTEPVSEAEIQAQSIQSTPSEKELRDTKDDGISVVSRSDDFTIELVGLEHVEARVGKSSVLKTPPS